MNAVYHKSSMDGGLENTRLGPIADTIVTTLSQDNLFNLSLVIVEILAAILLVLCTCWMVELGGFGFENHQIFNFHPICMTLGMIVLNANGILLYRMTKTCTYQRQKILHFTIQTSAIVISWIGFIAVYIFHSANNIAHFYSLHSWLGLTALLGVTISLVSSFLTFLFPKANAVYRKLALPFHVFGGIANIALSAGICCIGITEKALFKLTSTGYSHLPSMAILLNFFGIVLVTFTILVVWMVTKPEFKRRYTMSQMETHIMLRREKTSE